MSVKNFGQRMRNNRNYQKIKKIGILLDEDKVRRWFQLAIDELLEKNQVELSLIIVCTEKGVKNKLSEIKRVFLHGNLIREKILPFFILKLEKLLGMEPYYSQKIKIDDIDPLKDCQKLFCQSIPVGKYGVEVPDWVIKKIKAEEIDLIINRKKKILKGKILNSTPYGVISFHSGDIRKHRGARGFLTTYCRGEPEMIMTLQRINERADGGEIVVEKKINVKNAKSYKEFNDKVYFGMKDMLPRGINKLNSGFKPFSPKKLGKIYQKPGLLPFLSDLFKFLATEIKRKGQS